MLTFFSLFAIVLLSKYSVLHWFLFHDLLPRFQLKISNKSLYVHVFQITSCIYILMKTVINTEIKCLTL